MIENKNSHERFDTDNKNRHDHNGNAPLEARRTQIQRKCNTRISKKDVKLALLTIFDSIGDAIQEHVESYLRQSDERKETATKTTNKQRQSTALSTPIPWQPRSLATRQSTSISLTKFQKPRSSLASKSGNLE